MYHWMKQTVCAVALLATTATVAWAQADYPTRQVTLVVPYAAGGATDIIGRIVAQGLGDELNQTIVVQNVPGAGGSIGAMQVSRADPDGYTLLMGAMTSHSINMNLPTAPGFDLRTDFETVGLAGSVGLALVTRPDLAVDSFEAFLAEAGANPGQLAYASAGAGSPQHLGMEMLKNAADIDLVHVPYQGSSPAITDLIGGHVDVMFDTIPSVLPHVNSGAVKALAVTTPEPSPFLEGLPTVASAGVEGFDVQSWFGVLAPAGTPEAVTQRLNEVLNATLQKPETIAALEQQGVVASPGPREAQTALIESEIAKWQAVIETAGPLE